MTDKVFAGSFRFDSLVLHRDVCHAKSYFTMQGLTMEYPVFEVNRF